MVEKLNFSSIVWREGDTYVAWCPDLDIASQGKSIEESLERNNSENLLNRVA